MKWRGAAVTTSVFVSLIAIACGGGDDNGGSGNETDASSNDAATFDAGLDATSLDGSFAGDTSAPADASDGGVTVPAPRLIAPLSTSRVTTRRPTLKWVLPEGVTDATLDLCSDRQCAFSIASVHVTGTSYTPDANLPGGVVFWRLHPGTSTTVTSATWQFIVGAFSTPVDSSSGTTLDVNGDGYADAIVEGTDQANLLLGGPTGLSTTPATTFAAAVLLGDGGDANGSIVNATSAGDVNGDGFADVILGANTFTIDDAGGEIITGEVFLYFGGPTGLATTPASIVSGQVGEANFGRTLTSLGDTDGNGFGDVVIGSGEYSVDLDDGGTVTVPGVAYIYQGSKSGLAPAAIQTISNANASAFAGTVANAGDVDGNGYSDLLVSGELTIDGGALQRTTFLYLGSAAGVASSPNAAVDPGISFPMTSAGDVNGDGYDDIIVANADDDPPVTIYAGSAAGLVTTPATQLTGPTGFGVTVASAGDVNGDGYADVLVGDETAITDGIFNGQERLDAPKGSVFLFLGGAQGVTSGSALDTTGVIRGVATRTTVAAAWLIGPSSTEEFGTAVGSAGDVNADGYADILVGARYNVHNNNGFAYFGGPAKPAMLPDAGTPWSTVWTVPSSLLFGATY
jgi:hypothetical protein